MARPPAPPLDGGAERNTAGFSGCTTGAVTVELPADDDDSVWLLAWTVEDPPPECSDLDDMDDDAEKAQKAMVSAAAK